MRRKLVNYIPFCMMLAVLTWGCAQDKSTSADPAMKSAAVQQKDANVYKGKIVGKSNKAKTISIEVGKGDKAKTMMVRFDDRTKGVDHAEKGEAAIINWEMRGSDRFATVIKPKLAKLPEGVAEIMPKEVHELIQSKTDLLIIDSRPAGRYAQSHLPGAVSIPVEQMNKTQGVLPDNKDTLLIFYCGGYT